MALLKIDELSSFKKPLSYEQYFDGIGLDNEQVNSRIAYANNMENIMLWLFAFIVSVYGTEDFNYSYIRNELYSKVKTLVNETVGNDPYYENYVNNFVDEVLMATIRNADTPYFLSTDRAVYVSENEAQTVYNYLDYKLALASGFTKKQWVDVRDSHERVSHLEVGRKIIPIEDYFQVGSCLMRFPKDTENGTAEEIVNCRCHIVYM